MIKFDLPVPWLYKIRVSLYIVKEDLFEFICFSLSIFFSKSSISLKIVIHFLCLYKYYFDVLFNCLIHYFHQCLPFQQYQFLTVKVLTNFTVAACREILVLCLLPIGDPVCFLGPLLASLCFPASETEICVQGSTLGINICDKAKSTGNGRGRP